VTAEGAFLLLKQFFTVFFILDSGDLSQTKTDLLLLLRVTSL
jgi:hypothetical protein